MVSVILILIRSGFPSPHIKLVLTAITLVVYKPLLGLVSTRNMISCEYCESKFGRKSSLNRHLKTKHTDYMLWCEWCLFTTNRKDEFVKHMKKIMVKKINMKGDQNKTLMSRQAPHLTSVPSVILPALKKVSYKNMLIPLIR